MTESRDKDMTRFEYIKSLSETQLAWIIWVLLLSENTPLKDWRCISNVADWLHEEWIDNEYNIY